MDWMSECVCTVRVWVSLCALWEWECVHCESVSVCIVRVWVCALWVCALWECECVHCESVSVCTVRVWVCALWECECVHCESVSVCIVRVCIVRAWVCALWECEFEPSYALYEMFKCDTLVHQPLDSFRLCSAIEHVELCNSICDSVSW